MLGDPSQGEDARVRHLRKLGYVDPLETAAAQAERRRHHESELGRIAATMAQGLGAEAIAALMRLATDDPDWIAPRQLLAEAHFRAGDRTATREQLEWLALHNVVTPRLAVIAGTIALASRDLAAALAELEYACWVDPTQPGALALLGTAQSRLGRSDAAERAFRRAIELHADDALALDGLAAVALHRRDFEDAAHWALEALTRDMRLHRAHYHLGIALVHLHRPEAAAEAFATCARLDPSRAAPLCWLARLAAHRGDTAGAAEYRGRAREIRRRRRVRHEIAWPTRPPADGASETSDPSSRPPVSG